MTKIINKKEDIPSWFNLEKYKGSSTQKGCKEFTAHDWLEALTVRRLCYTAGNEDSIIMSLTREDPLGASITTKNPSFDPDFQPVKPLTFIDIMSQHRIDKYAQWVSYKPENPVEAWELVVDLERSTRLEHLYELPLQIEKSTSVTVNLNATDKVILNSFKRWLKSQREHHKTPKRNKPNYLKWADYGLLPYMDLYIWQWQNNCKITDEFMADLIGYRHGGDKEQKSDSFRNTVPPLAKKLMGSLSELMYLAVDESASPTT